MLQVQLFGVGDPKAMQAALDIRRRVFVEEQGVPIEEEIDEHDTADPLAVHALATLSGAPVGTGRFFVFESGCVQIGRMAVLPGARRVGAGRALLAALAAEAARLGYRRARLLAQVSALSFYARAGFATEGGRPAWVWDAAILHCPMERSLGGD